MSDYGSVTQCPKCKTSFHVGPAQLEAARGRVRCGGCLNVFDAREYFIVEQKPLFGGGPPIEEASSTQPGDSGHSIKFQDLQEAGSDSSSETISANPEEDWDQKTGMDFDEDDSEEVFFNPRADDDEDIFPPLRPVAEEELEAEVDSNTLKADAEGGPFEEGIEPDSEVEATDQESESESESESEEPEPSESGETAEYNELDESVEAAESIEEIEEEAQIEDVDLPEEAEDAVQEPEPKQEPEPEPESKTQPENDEWISVIPERSGLHAPEPEINLPKEPEQSEEEQLVEQLFVGSETRSRIKPRSIGWLCGVAALLAVLVIQSLYWQPASLREFPFYNQVSQGFCEQFLCREVVLQDISQLDVSGIVRPSSEYNNSLSVQIELRNRAESSQHFPHIELAFTDLRGETISLRRFGPQEYLRAETAGRTLMAPYQRVQIEFELYDPGASAISYEFSLRYLN